LGIIPYIQENTDLILELILQHLGLSLGAVLIAFLLGTPLGIILTRYKKISAVGLNVLDILYTIPSLALFGIMIPILGMGIVPALTALIIYSLLPIVQNAYAGIKNVDRSIIEAAQGMGMSKNRILLTIELPLALAVIMAGLRTALANSIGIATIAAYIGAGGLGVLVFRGISSVSPTLIIVGSTPVLLMAIVGDHLLKKVEDRLTFSD